MRAGQCGKLQAEWLKLSGGLIKGKQTVITGSAAMAGKVGRCLLIRICWQELAAPNKFFLVVTAEGCGKYCKTFWGEFLTVLVT